METNLWASLVDHIFRKMDDWLRLEKKADNVSKLYEQLSTARTLKLEALEALISARRHKKEATQRLNGLRREIEKVENERARLKPSEFWSAVGKVAKGQFTKDDKEEVEKAIDILGFKDAKDSAGALVTALEQARETGDQGRLLWRSMVSRAGSPAGAGLLIVAILGLPLAASGALALLPQMDFVDAIKSASLTLSSTLAGLSLWVGGTLGVASRSLTRLRSFQAKLDEKLESRGKDEPPDSILQSQAHIAQLKGEVALAESELARAGDRAAQALEGFGERPHERLHRFIREKIAKGDYAKHLGIIASIRKDFEQLAQIMQEEKDESEASRDYEAERQAYAARLQALLDVAKLKGEESATEEEGLLADEEEDLQKEIKSFEGPRSDQDLRFFRRIVLYIDDLDRCPPDKVVDVLQACHLLLCFPLFVVVSGRRRPVGLASPDRSLPRLARW